MAHRLVEAALDAWNDQDGHAFAALMAEESSFEDHGWGGAVYSKKTIGRLIAFVATFSSDYRFSLTSVLEEGTNFACEWEMRGTHDGPLTPFGIPATGKPLTLRGSIFFDTDGKCFTRFSSYWSIFDLLHQLEAPISTNVDWGMAYMVERSTQPYDS